MATSGILLVGVLSGMIFGVLGMFARRYAATVILFPVVAVPALFVVASRDALIGHCFFASRFASPSCGPFREFIFTIVAHAGDTATIMACHVVVSFVTLFLIQIASKVIAEVDLSSPREKAAREQAIARAQEARALALEQAREARALYDDEVARLTSKITGIPIDKIRQMRELQSAEIH